MGVKAGYSDDASCVAFLYSFGILTVEEVYAAYFCFYNVGNFNYLSCFALYFFGFCANDQNLLFPFYFSWKDTSKAKNFGLSLNPKAKSSLVNLFSWYGDHFWHKNDERSFFIIVTDRQGFQYLWGRQFLSWV